jgi:integrase
MLRGWLKNPDRKMRRERAYTLRESQVLELLEAIEALPKYSRLDESYGLLLRRRDKALVALWGVFFKRASENLRVRVGDVYVSDDALSVTFRISKKRRRVKVCRCGEENGRRARYCRICGADIGGVEVAEKGGAVTVTKNKMRTHPMVPPIAEWVEAARTLGADEESYLFPHMKILPSSHFLWGRHLTVQRFDQILQRLDPTLTSHMARYGMTENLLRRGYLPSEVREIGDWASSYMPELYARKKGLTPVLRRFETDTRIS